jgi:hypothetical protein
MSLSNLMATSPLDREIAHKLHRFVLLHHASFWFVMCVLVFALVVFLLYANAVKTFTREQQNKYKNVAVATVVGVIATSVAILFLGLHYLHPFVN